jgi:hypothetical protein
MLSTCAKWFAIFAHWSIGHKRKYTGEPYSVHLAEVAALVELVGGSEYQIAAAWLHDTVEDTWVALWMIRLLFGWQVADMVDGLTEVSIKMSGNRKVRKEADRIWYSKQSPDTKTIKLADNYSNLSSAADCDPHFASMYFSEAADLLISLEGGNQIIYTMVQSMVSNYDLRMLEKVNQNALYDELVKFHEKNSSGVFPYHNNSHMDEVYKLSLTLYRREKTKPLPETLEYNELYFRMVLVLATMVHDYGHTGGRLDDVENIQIAIKALRKFVSHSSALTPLRRGHPELMQGILEKAIAAIVCTEFPFVHEPQSLLEKIVRDADLLYTAVMGKPEIVLEGLRAEIRKKLKRFISYTEMLEGQKAFLNNATLYTETGKQLWAEKAAPFYAAMEAYVEKVSRL